MIVTIKEGEFKGETITDDARLCNSETLFLKTKLNEPYLDQALDNGAKGVVTPTELLATIAMDTLKVIATTGTNGKTSTSAAIYSLLLDLGYKVALLGTRGFFMNDALVDEKSLTTPMPLNLFDYFTQAIEKGCDYFVMEVSSHAIVQQRAEGVKFAMKILTNITQDHLDYHKTFEEYARVKNAFFEDESMKLINKDEPLAQYNVKNCYTYGIENPSTFKIESYSLTNGIGAVIKFGDEIGDFHSPMRGFFNLYNLLAAVGAVRVLTKKPLSEICDVVENFAGVSGRMEVVSNEPLVIVDFAHTPDGIVKAMDALKDRELVVVLGAGGDRDHAKRPLMGKEASLRAKRVYITSDNPRSEDPATIADEILSGVVNSAIVITELDRKSAIEMAYRSLQNEEVLLILGKGDETTQEIKGVMYPFDDRVIIRNLV